MRVPARTRALAVLAASASLLALPLASPASAANQPGKCTKLVTKTVNGNVNVTLSGCTPTAAVGGKGTGTFKSCDGCTSGQVAVTIKWSNKKGTTKGKVKFGPAVGLGKCPVGSARLKITGKVTGGTGTAVKTIKANQPITASVCSGDTITLEKGTAMKF